jgi:methyl-accepting chemotaxis protein
MNSLVNLKISYKLGLAFTLCLFLSALLGVTSLVKIANLNSITQGIVTKSFGPVLTFSQFRFSIRQLVIDEYRSIMASRKEDITAAESDMTADIAKANKAIDTYQATATDPQDKQNIAVLVSDWTKYQALDAELRPLAENNTNDTADAAMMGQTMLPLFKTILADDVTIVSWDQSQVDSSVKTAGTEFTAARNTIIFIIALLFLIGGVAAGWITRYMTTALLVVSDRFSSLSSVCIAELKTAIAALEHGDLTSQLADTPPLLAIKSKDEFGALACVCNNLVEQTQSAVDSFRNTQASLTNLVVKIQSSASFVNATSRNLAATTQEFEASTDQIRESMADVAKASEQSARGAGEVAQGSASQATSISTGSELVKQLADSVHAVALDAKKAESATADVAAAATAGAKSVTETIEGIHAIGKSISESASVIKTLSDSSNQIGTIVQTIEEIADQTNLLALNAAIEAARAGDAGRGFAVVADEVRKLAERSRTATQEIGDLIRTVQNETDGAVRSMEGGVRAVSANTETADRAGKALSQIQNVVATAAMQVKAIAESAGKMTVSSDEVARTISEVAAIIEESSASAEEMSASAEEVAASVQTVTDTTHQQRAGLLELVSSTEKLSEISQSLLDDVSSFKVLGDGGVTAGKAESEKPKLRISRAA